MVQEVDRKIDSQEVEIFGKKVSLFSTQESSDLEACAKLVDQKMREISKRIPDISRGNLSLLAAMNIADDHLRMKQKNALKWKETEERILSLIKEIEAKISRKNVKEN